MRRWITLGLMLFLYSANFTEARPAVVRSGEHDGFSRLVLTFDSTPDWSLGRTEQGYELRLAERTQEYDLREAFARIPRTRVSDIIASTGGALDFVVNCTCFADAFLFDTKTLVIDIISGSAPQQAKFEQNLSLSAPTTESKKLVPLNLPLKGIGRTFTPPFELPGTPAMQSERTADSQDMGTSIEDYRRLEAARTQVVEQVGWAATLGLLNVDTIGQKKRPRKAVEPNAELGESAEAATSPDTSSNTPSLNLNLNTENSIDRDVLSESERPAVTPLGSECLASDKVGVAAWGQEDTAIGDLGFLRRSLVGEFDRPSSSAVLALARAYIYLGFGAEAIATLDSFETEISDRDILVALAGIMDGRPIGADTALQSQTACDSSVALWAVLALPEITRGLPISQAAVLSAFSALPRHLRDHLGPRLSDMFLEVGNVSGATAIRNAVARTMGDHGNDFALIDAKLGLLQGQTDDIETNLQEIISKDDTSSPLALIELIKTKLAIKGKVDPDLILAAVSFAYEQKTSALGRALYTTAIAASLSNGDFDEARENLARLEIESAVSAVDIAQLRSQVFRRISEDSSDAEFMRQVLKPQSSGELTTVDRPVRLEVARRLVQLGEPNTAEVALSSSLDPTSDEKYILAVAALDQLQSDKALSYLDALTGVEARRLRARAYLLKGDLAKASAELTDLSPSQERRDIAWRMGNWDEVAEFGTEEQKAMAGLERQPLPVTDRKNPITLEENGNILQKSRDLRGLVDNLLQSLPLDQ